MEMFFFFFQHETYVRICQGYASSEGCQIGRGQSHKVEAPISSARCDGDSGELEGNVDRLVGLCGLYGIITSSVTVQGAFAMASTVLQQAYAGLAALSTRG